MALLFARLLVLIGVVVVFIYVARRLARRSVYRAPNERHSFDPYAVLGVSRGASETEIKEAYRRELMKYHPDKVDHLGADLQALARKRTTEIIEAYESLTGGR